ncbi:hypothetical protein KZX46_21740 (plasmid) [Polymorphobacter sp. PAMC 29334]|uniref:DUF6437 family protein n=1 Tax=Polymorphobacter sp. PAMC 29334 TaxID=2862331 RepID=UPI001C71B365|nr:DUF6437 family protein [Polymorphobacter sp. PAMC 29334]QYE37258.1 hypothetical protein KZX46_21740 [Polymorphobacter sp. PAMC 29334]
MAAGKSAAVEAYERAEDEMRKQQARVAEARKAAAREVGEAVLATGAGKLPTAQLKAILGAVVAMGGEQALTALGVKATGSDGSKANGGGERGSGPRGQTNGAASDDGKPVGAVALL